MRNYIIIVVILIFLLLCAGCNNNESNPNSTLPNHETKQNTSHLDERTSLKSGSSDYTKNQTSIDASSDLKVRIYQSAISVIDFSAKPIMEIQPGFFIPFLTEPDRNVILYRNGSPEILSESNNYIPQIPQEDQKYVVVIIGNITYRSGVDYRDNRNFRVYPSYRLAQFISVVLWPEKQFVGNYILIGSDPAYTVRGTSSIQQNGKKIDAVVGENPLDVNWSRTDPPENIVIRLFNTVKNKKVDYYALEIYNVLSEKHWVNRADDRLYEHRPDIILNQKGAIDEYNIIKVQNNFNYTSIVYTSVKFLPNSAAEQRNYSAIFSLIREHEGRGYGEWKIDEMKLSLVNS